MALSAPAKGDDPARADRRCPFSPRTEATTRQVNYEHRTSVWGDQVNSNNLLVNLHRYSSRQDENFVTEAFAHLVRHLLENEPDVAVRILARLSGGALSATAESAPAITVTTQVTTAQGRPDIEITAVDTLVYVEAKV